MSDPENNQNQPLIGGYPAINVPSANGGRSSKAYKVAGLTLLACVLIAGQAMIAYFLLSQRGDIKTLEEQNNNLKTEMTRGRSVAVPMRMHMPMNALPEVMDDSGDEEASARVPEKTAPPATDCQLEAAGVKPVPVPGFRPSCDERGNYQAQQCFGSYCWCVNPTSGQVIPGSARQGPARCSAVAPVGMGRLMIDAIE